ncbi:hypothetical protein [Paratissierella segnis]|jgi:hypothetical protein|uniref:Uncharacterized protein n=1 Tax=Paratissierella segnis TaxID=2763679 RepID=A0A926EVR8_9FIRM|nr:hypothetical protein [Paratissierella segnis]MBC8589415.1 hypothetical protein [Paratissierella segnis]
MLEGILGKDNDIIIWIFVILLLTGGFDGGFGGFGGFDGLFGDNWIIWILLILLLFNDGGHKH